MLTTVLAVAVSAWGVQCPVQIDWADRVVAGEGVAAGITGYPPDTRLGGLTHPGQCRIVLSVEWWRQHRHPRYRCDLLAHEVGHIALTGIGIPGPLQHSLPGPMSEPVGQAFDACRRWYRTTRHYQRWRAMFARR